MTTPLERAMQSIDSKVEEIYASEKLPTNLDLARSVLESIDTDQLARVFHPGYGQDGFTPENCAPCKEALDTAHAVKAWLTGKEPQ